MKKFLKELETLAKKHGLQVLHECTHCGANASDLESPGVILTVLDPLNKLED